jgi:VanZ family protein
MTALARAWYAPRGVLYDYLPALLYLTALFAFGLMPMKSLPGPNFALADKAWHLLAFAGLAVLLSRVALHLRRPALQAARLGALLSAALGGALELLQSLTRYRAAELADLLADALGAGLAYLALRALAHAAAASGEKA